MMMDLMQPTSYPPQDGYALDILSQAAIHSHQADSTAMKRTRNDIRGSSTAPITNQRSTRSNTSQLGNQNILNDFNPSMWSARDLDALAFNPSPSSYSHRGHEGMESQSSTDNANGLGILNAESYDDGRGELSRKRPKQQTENMLLPFGVAEKSKSRATPESRVETEDHEPSSRRKRRKTGTPSPDDDGDSKGKARGRPRVDPKDETAADRRRTQIRLAQRAYRHRKETAISSLQKQVHDLKGTNEEMSNIFIGLYDFAVSNGLLQREPEFGHQLQSSTERFLAVAKASVGGNAVEGIEDGANSDEDGAARQTKVQKTSPKKLHEDLPPASEPTPWGGYMVSKDETPEVHIRFGQENQYGEGNDRERPSDIEVITRPTEDNASFPFDFMDLQQYRVEVPEIDDFSLGFSPQAQLPLPGTHSYSESSFARRIHRGATERAFRLITSKDPSTETILQRVFGFCLLYESREAIEARLKRLIGKSAKETLHEWRAPFVHVGGSGTYYPGQDDTLGSLMPRFRTGYSMGPFSPSVTQAQEVLDEDFKCNLPRFQGEFFDPYDVEGYLRSRGLDIAPDAEFVTAELDLLALTEAHSPKSLSSDSATSTTAPETPGSIIDNPLINPDKELNAFNLDLENADSSLTVTDPLTQLFPFPLEYADWESGSPARTSNESIDRIFNSTTAGRGASSGLPSITTSDRRYGNGRTVIVNISVLLKGVLDRGVCLGRAPGFRRSDVDAALIAAVSAVS